MRMHSARANFSFLLRILCPCILVILLTFGREANALDPHKSIAQYAHEVWSTKNGLPETDVMAILQTKDGYLWVGTEEGLARFDGARFVVFDRKTAGLPNNRVQTLAQTPDGSLWIGTENGLSRLKNRQFTNYSTRDGLPSNTIRDLWRECVCGKARDLNLSRPSSRLRKTLLARFCERHRGRPGSPAILDSA
jgi:ligand-binding sensor domain-containing protein